MEILLIVEEGGSLINVSLTVYFDVVLQSSSFNFPRSKQSLFYVFEVFINGRGRFILTYFDKVRVRISDHPNRVRSMFLEFLCCKFRL